MSEMPEVIWAYADDAQGYGGHWFDKPAPVDDGSDTVKYTRIPEGYVLVPIEPTEEMVKSGVQLALNTTISGKSSWDGYITNLYKAMIEKAGA